MKPAITRTGISLPTKLLKTGRKIARRKNRNFSSYIADLIEKDAARPDSDNEAR